MRLNNHLRVIATTATLVAAGSPAAQAAAIGQGGGDPALPSHHAVAATSHSGSTDWALIALAGGGTAVLVGVGVGGSRRAGRRRSGTRTRVA
jgi:hypothetical protein